MAALPFTNWKGSMKFRFQIVCSSFHKGRLKFVYDPNFIANNTYLGFSEYNTNYLKIVDIAEEQDFTIEIGNGQERNFLNHAYPGDDSVTTMYSTSRYTSKGTGNGVIGVIVVNELTTPNSTVTNDIEINVYVSMGDDFEVAAPDDYFQHFVLKPQSGVILDPQMGEIVPESQNTEELDAPQQTESTIVGLPPVEHNDLNKVFFGEAITSFRTMLKRYNLWNTIAKVETSSTTISVRYPSFPYMRGSVSGAVDLTSLASPYNYVNTILLHWVRSAFSGHRGSIRYKLVPRGFISTIDRVEVQRAPYFPSSDAYSVFREALPSYGNDKLARFDIMTQWQFGSGNNVPIPGHPFPGTRGMALTTFNVNSILEYEVPYYSPYRFTPGKLEDLTTSNLFEASYDIRWFSNGGQNSTVMDVYVAAGEDFQCYFFTGLPRMYFETFPPN
jgi:hypothetical protein